jgi:molybdate transport system substrate-binding protein
MICNRLFALVGIIVALFNAGCAQSSDVPSPGAADDTQPVVFVAAASTKDAVEAIVAAFEKKTGEHVRLATGPSNALAVQIESGAPAHLFLSANEKWAEYLRAKHLVADQTPLLTNDLVLITPSGNPADIHSAADLAELRVRRVALAGENVPAGTYAEQALRAASLYERLTEQNKFVRGDDVRITLNYVARGEADAGVVYETDARLDRRVEVVYRFDSKTYDPIVYPLVRVKRQQANRAADALFEYLRAPEAQKVFAEFGFRSTSGRP